MKVGLGVPQFGINSTKENLIKFIQSAEKKNFESFWVCDRMLYPLDPRQPYPGTPDQKNWPDYFKNVLDPLTTLSFVAANTSKPLLGTAIIDMLFHNPVTLGKEFATIDILSEGRMICGLGIGWSEDEYIASNHPYDKKGPRTNEFLASMKKVWTEDEVEFDGEFYKIPRSIINPKPAQKPHPKLLLGGFSPKTFERMIKYGNGYLGALIGPFEYFKQLAQLFNESIEKSSRSREEFDFTVLTFPYLMEGSNSGEDRMPMTGTVDQIGSDLSRLKEFGVDRVILAMNSDEGYEVDQALNTCNELREFCK